MPREEEESLIVYLKKELEAALVRNDSLEKENQDLRREVVRLKAQVSSLKAHDNERKSMLWKKLQNSNDNSITDMYQQKQPDLVKVAEQRIENPNPVPTIQELAVRKRTPEKVEAPLLKHTSVVPPSPKEQTANAFPSIPAPPPPPPLSIMPTGLKPLRRVPEVVEFYRLLTRKDTHLGKKANPAATSLVAVNMNMIGEIENRSTYLSAIKSDVEKRKEHISFLIKEVESVTFKDISDVEPFVKWLDNELSSLIDERAVLKHFPLWPESKADALREAAFNYRDLRNLHSEVSSFRDNPKEPLTQALGKIQTLQDRLEQRVNSMERMREGMMKRYRDFQIPWAWLLNTGLVGQIKLSSLRLAIEYMKRVTKELQLNEYLGKESHLLPGAKFAYRIHQFAGGFDAETLEVFQGLKRVGMGNDKANY